MLERLETRTLMSADVVLTWNQHVMEAIRADRTMPGPTWASRNFAIVQAAVFDAAESIDHSFQPFLIHEQAPKGASMDAAIASAAAQALLKLYPQQAKRIRHELAESLGIIADGKSVNDGAKIGRKIADQILALRANDGSTAMTNYMTSIAPGHWQ